MEKSAPVKLGSQAGWKIRVNEDRFADTKLMRLQLCLYLLPVVGILPSLWQLRQPDQPGWVDHQYHRQRRRLSRRSLQLTLGWLCLYLLLWGTGQGTGELAGFRLMYLNGLISTGYFLACLLSMGRIFFQPLPSAKK